jgi:hypothetical protein
VRVPSCLTALGPKHPRPFAASFARPSLGPSSAHYISWHRRLEKGEKREGKDSPKPRERAANGAPFRNRRRRRSEEAAIGCARGAAGGRGGGGVPHLGAAGRAAAAGPDPPPAQGCHPHGGARPRLARPLADPLGAPLRRRGPPGSRDALEKEPRPRRRLHRFSLTVDTCKFTSSHLRRFLGYAAECRAEDLRVEMWTASKLKFHLPRSSPLLARLSLRRIGFASMYYRGAQPLRALEVVVLHSVSITQAAVKKMLALCPGLRTLNLRACDADSFFYWDRSVVWPPNLRSVTVAECDGMATLNLVRVPSLRSFRYSDSFLDAPFSLPRDAALADLYICFEESVAGDYNTRRLNNTLPNDLSDLNVLTICSNALPVFFSLLDFVSSGCVIIKLISCLILRKKREQNRITVSYANHEFQVAFSLSDDGATCQLPKQRSLHSLR